MSHLFSNQSDHYKMYRPSYPDELYAFLFKHTNRFGRALDCGTGNGQVAVRLAEKFDEVIGIDISKEQIARAFEGERITYKVADASESGLDSESVDLITAAQALHWFNTDKFYREVERILKPSGLLACWGYGLCTVNDQIDPLIQSFYDDVIGPFWPRQRMHIEEEYNSLRFPYPTINHPDVWIKKSWNLDQLLGYFRSWSSTQRYMQYKGYDPVRMLAVRLKRYWGDTEEPKHIYWPVFIKAGKKE